MTVKQTTSLNILRGITYFLSNIPNHEAALDTPDTFFSPITVSMSKMVESIRRPSDLFDVATKCGTSASRMIQLAETFEAELIQKGWHVSRASDAIAADSFLNKVAELMESEFGREAVKLQRIAAINPSARNYMGGSYRGALLAGLRDFVVNEMPINGLIQALKFSGGAALIQPLHDPQVQRHQPNPLFGMPAGGSFAAE